MENFTALESTLDRESLNALSGKQNNLSLIKFLLHLSLLLIFCYLAIRFRHDPIGPILIITGVFLWCSFYAPFHECIHRTAFRSKKLNDIGAWISSFFFGCSPGVHREQHFTHHRFTNIQGRDPEILIDLKDSFFKWMIQLLITSIALNLVPVFSLVLTLAPIRYWDKLAPYIPFKKRLGIKLESLLVTVVWLTGIYFVIKHYEKLYPVLYILIGAKVLHSFWTYVDHEGLSSEGSMLERTRSFKTNRLISWFIWNMNYHAEHHQYPGVPWHHLPELNTRMGGEQPHLYQGYFSFYLDKLRGL